MQNIKYNYLLLYFEFAFLQKGTKIIEFFIQHCKTSG